MPTNPTSSILICALTCMLIACSTPLAGAETALPLDVGTITIPPEWSVVDGVGFVLRGPGRTALEAPRLAITTAVGDVDATTASLRDGYRRVADGCEILDDDTIPLGGRVWHRLRVRFATGPMAIGQSAWVGSVDGRTVVAVLSAPDEYLSSHLAKAAESIASISALR